MKMKDVLETLEEMANSYREVPELTKEQFISEMKGLNATDEEIAKSISAIGRLQKSLLEEHGLDVPMERLFQATVQDELRHKAGVWDYYDVLGRYKDMARKSA